MASLSNYAEDKLNDHLLGTTAFTMPATVYLALYTTDPTDADTGTEVSGGAYARQTIAFSASSGGAASNSADVTFPVATANWGIVTHIGLRDASTGGNLLAHGALSTSKQIDTDDQFVMPSTDLTSTLS